MDCPKRDTHPITAAGNPRVGNTVDIVKPTDTPVVAPLVQIATSTPTPLPGLSPKSVQLRSRSFFCCRSQSSKTKFTRVIRSRELCSPLFLESAFGKTLDNLQLVYDSSGDLVAKNETAGNLFGLATLAVYGFGIQDAYNTAVSYNKKNYLTFHLGITPRPNANLAYMF